MRLLTYAPQYDMSAVRSHMLQALGDWAYDTNEENRL